MRCYVYIVFVLFFGFVNSTFWYKDDFDRVTSGYQNSLSQDYFPYLRALSIFKRKLQLLGFYPIVSNDDGLEYVSLDPYIIEEDYDDQMYELLKKMKKEKKARKKFLKKKSKKAKKTKKPSPTASSTMTTVQPISNIVYYWPSTITTIVKPNAGTNTYEHSIETSVSGSIGNTNIDYNPNNEDSLEENSEEVDEESPTTYANYPNQNKKTNGQKPANINYETNFGSRKLTFEEEVASEIKDMSVQKQSSVSSTTSTSTTTAYPLITVFPDPDEVAIQEILDQQEVINKISDEVQKNETKIISNEVKDGDITAESSANDEDNLIKNDTALEPSIELPTGHIEGNKEVQHPQTQLKETNKEEVQEVLQPKSTQPFTISTDETEPTADSIDSSIPTKIPAGVLDFFHDTLPEHDELSSNPQEHQISDEITETTERNETVNGHSEIPSGLNDVTVQMKGETTTSNTTDRPFDENSTIDEMPSNADKIYFDQDIPNQVARNSQQSEEYEFSIDPKISIPTELDDVQSRELTDKPLLAVMLDDKSGRRSDVPIEADDFLEEDTTDNLPYHLSGENVLEQSKQSNIIEDNSAETSTPPTTESLKFDNADQFGGDIIPLIPIIIKQMKEGNVIPEEMEILKNTFGQFWPFIVEEASRESNSSEEMNPILNDVLNSVNRRVLKREATVRSDVLKNINKGRVKREATVGRWRRPIYGRRVYLDDDDHVIPRRRYYGRRRRPIVEYYYK